MYPYSSTFLRRSGLTRPYSASVSNPCLKKDLFTRRTRPTNILDLPLNLYPNPLLTFEKEEILKLKERELSHLLSIPGGNPAELERLFLNVVLIIHDNLITNTPKATYFIEKFENSGLELPLTAFLKERYKDNRLRRSLLIFLEDPSSKEAHKEVRAVIDQMVAKLEKKPPEAAHMILNYLKKLSVVNIPNHHKLYLSSLVLGLLLKNLSEFDKRCLFSCLVLANFKFSNKEHHDKLRISLLQGSPLSKLVVRTGLMDPKWHDVAKYNYSNTHRNKMVRFFTFSELKRFAEWAILEKNLLDSNLYLELLVRKFEQSSKKKHLQGLLQVMLLYSMVLKGPKECVRFLRYYVESGLEVRMETLLKTLQRLRQDGIYDEALFLINFLHREDLTPEEHQTLVLEIIMVMKEKFAEHPQIVVGYFAALFNDEEKNALHLLKDLKLLDLVYGREGGLVLVDIINEAVVHEDLKNSRLEHSILFQMYALVLKWLSLEQSTSPLLIKSLYDSYIAQVKRAVELNDKESLFHVDNLDESVISLFVEYLLREDPHQCDSMRFTSRRLNYETAKQIATHFFSVANVDRSRKKIYLADILIYAGLLTHNDLAFALVMLKRARATNLPVTFNQIYPFTQYHLDQKEYDEAKYWFLIMAENGVKAKSPTAVQLYKTAKQLGWPMTGTKYLQAYRLRNKKTRQELQNIESDPISVLPSESSADLPNKQFNFVEDLASVLIPLSIKS